MCTAASFKSKDVYFGRTLDYEFSYGEKVVITPHNYPFNFRHIGENENHYAIIGMAHIHNDYPLYYDAMNEHGLGMAGLNFVGNAKYNNVINDKINVASYEFISFILANCKSINEVIDLMKNINITNIAYNDEFKVSSLHWILKDKSKCIVIESMEDGIHIYNNKTGVLTNNPPFNYQMENLKNYTYLTNKEMKKNFSFNNDFYTRAMGTIGLPGDLTSQSRFVRVAFTSHYSVSLKDEISSVNQFFHILESVWQTKGLCKINDAYEITIYASCMNLNENIYYYKTYDNSMISAISLNKEDLDTDKLISYNLSKTRINYQN